MIPIDSANVAAELDRVTEHWSPRNIARVGDSHMVPKGAQHNPIADEEASVVLIAPVTTARTGSVVTDRTVSVERQTAR